MTGKLVGPLVMAVSLALASLGLVAPAAAAATGPAAAVGNLDLRSGLVGTAVSIGVDGSAPVLVGSETVGFGLVAAGAHRVVVYGAATGSVVITAIIDVAPAAQVTAFVYTDPSGHVQVVGITSTVRTAPAGQAAVSVTDVSQYAGGLDVYDNDVLIAADLSDGPSGPQTVAGTVPAGAASLTVTQAGHPGVVLASLPGRAVLAGDVLQVFVVGNPTTAPSTLSILASARTLGLGYRLYAADGGVFDFGNAGFYGSTGALHLNQPIVGAATDNLGLGYWLVAADGGIFSFGDSAFFGSTGAIHLNEPIVGMAATPDAGGYWLVARDGGIFSFGDARFFGSTGAVHLNEPIVGMAATPDGQGYWLVAADGGIFSFGDAAFHGSTGSLVLNQPIVGMAPTLDGRGYWLVATDGGIFNFGDAGFYGATGAEHLDQPIVGMMATPDSLGYDLVAADGGIFSFGDAAYFGSAGSVHLSSPIIAASLPGSPSTS